MIDQSIKTHLYSSMCRKQIRAMWQPSLGCVHCKQHQTVQS